MYTVGLTSMVGRYLCLLEDDDLLKKMPDPLTPSQLQQRAEGFIFYP